MSYLYFASPSMSTTDFAKLIKDFREANDLSQRDLAQRLEVSQQTIAHWEQGGFPRGKRLDKLNEVLGVGLGAPLMLGETGRNPFIGGGGNNGIAGLGIKPPSLGGGIAILGNFNALAGPLTIGGGSPQLGAGLNLGNSNALAGPLTTGSPTLGNVNALNNLGKTPATLGNTMASFQVSAPTAPKGKAPAAPQTDTKGNFIDPASPKPQATPERDQVGSLGYMERIRQIHARRPIGPRGTPAAHDGDSAFELRSLREQAFIEALLVAEARGQRQAAVRYGAQTRWLDYLSSSVVAELVEISGPDVRMLTPMRYAQGLVRIAVMKSTRPELQAVLILVVETGDLSEFQLVAERVLSFDCQALGLVLRVVDSFEAAARAIVNLEKAAPYLMQMSASERPDSFDAEGSVGPGNSE